MVGLVESACSYCGGEVEPYSRWTCEDCGGGPAPRWFACQGCAGRWNYLLGHDEPGIRPRRLKDEGTEPCWDWSHRFAPVVPSGGWLTLDPGPEAGKLVRVRRFVRSFLPAQAPPGLYWIAVQGDPAHAAAVAAAAVAAAAAAGGARGGGLAASSLAAAAAAALQQDNRSNAERVEAAQADWAVHQSLGTCSGEAAQQIARRSGLMDGKWMVFVSAASEGVVWPAVASAVYAQGLCPSAKITGCQPTRPGDDAGRKDDAGRVICVYTNDFSDRQDVMRVHAGLSAALRKAMPKKKWGSISYKPDIYTYLEIYGGNPWKIKPSLYTVKVAARN